MAARVILRIVGIMRRVFCMKAVAQSVEEIARVAGRIRAIHRRRCVVTIFRRMTGEFIGANVVVVVMFVRIVRQHGSRAEAHQTGGGEEDQGKARTGCFHMRSQTRRACRYSKFPNRSARVQSSRFTERSRSALAITETELRLIAAPAMIGLRSRPKNG